jgi:hypothetical protein
VPRPSRPSQRPTASAGQRSRTRAYASKPLIVFARNLAMGPLNVFDQLHAISPGLLSFEASPDSIWQHHTSISRTLDPLIKSHLKTVTF